MKFRFRIAALSGVAVLVGTGTWTAISVASRASTAARLQSALTVNPLSVVVKDVNVVQIPDQTVYSVDPGDVVDAQVACPKDSRSGNTLNTWTIVGGGYHMFGYDGAAVPSATAAYPSDKTATYKVVVANPKLASGPITFFVEASCMDVQSGPLGT